MNYNNDTLVYFKTDGVVWEMYFEEQAYSWMGEGVLYKSTVVGGCYAGAYKTGQPCFNQLMYDDPKAFVSEKNKEPQEVDATLGKVLSGIYTVNYVKGLLSDTPHKVRLT